MDRFIRDSVESHDVVVPPRVPANLDTNGGCRRTLACTGDGGRAGFKWRVITAGPVMRVVLWTTRSGELMTRKLRSTAFVNCPLQWQGALSESRERTSSHS